MNLVTIISIGLAGTVGALAACTPGPYYPVDRMFRPASGTLEGGWAISSDTSVAAGTRSCNVRRGPLTVFQHRMEDGTVLRWVSAVTGDGLYPGSTVHLAIDGKRFSGEEHIGLSDELMEALKTGGVAHISWSPWPWGDREETAVPLRGFADKFTRCQAFVSPEVESPEPTAQRARTALLAERLGYRRRDGRRQAPRDPGRPGDLSPCPPVAQP